MEKKIIDFYGAGCGNCKMLESILAQIGTEFPDIKIEKLDVAAETKLVEKYGVSSLPTLVFIKNGKMVDKMAGLKPKSLIVKKIAEIF